MKYKDRKDHFNSTALESYNLDSSLAIDLMFVTPTPKLYVEVLPHNMMIFGGGAFGRRLDHEGRALINEISSLIKETPENFFASSTM